VNKNWRRASTGLCVFVSSSRAWRSLANEQRRAKERYAQTLSSARGELCARFIDGLEACCWSCVCALASPPLGALRHADDETRHKACGSAPREFVHNHADPCRVTIVQYHRTDDSHGPQTPQSPAARSSCSSTLPNPQGQPLARSDVQLALVPPQYEKAGIAASRAYDLVASPARASRNELRPFGDNARSARRGSSANRRWGGDHRLPDAHGARRQPVRNPRIGIPDIYARDHSSSTASSGRSPPRAPRLLRKIIRRLPDLQA